MEFVSNVCVLFNVSREEAEKLHYAEGQGCLLHQLHLGLQRLLEQRGFWENKLIQTEQEKLWCEEEARTFASEKKRLEEQQEVQFCSLQGVLHSCRLKTSQSEARAHFGQVEEDLKASGKRCCDLEARMEEACTQLEESIGVLETQEVLTWREKNFAQKQLKEQLRTIQAASDSAVFDDQTFRTLRSELEAKDDCLCKLTAELDSLKRDRSRLIQDLKEQAMAVDDLRLELEGVGEKSGMTRSTEEHLQEALTVEQTRTSQLQSSLDEEKEEVGRLSKENRSYTQLAYQLSIQILEMEEEISTLRDHLRGLSSRLNETANLVPDLQTQLTARTSEVDRLQAELVDVLQEAKTCAEQHCSGELDLVRGQVLQLQQALLVSQSQLRTTEEDFDLEKRKMTQQLMELERLVLVLEEVMDPDSPHRFVEHETGSKIRYSTC